jgi:uncharacterized membrane protein
MATTLDTKKLTLMAVMAAVYTVGSFLPGFPMVGAAGTIDLVRALEMGYGILLGPVYGPMAAFLGALIGKILTGGGFGMFMIPLAPVTAFIAASLSRPKVFKMRGWMYPVAIISALCLGWYLTPTGRAVYYFPVWHLIGLGIILIFRGRMVDLLQSENRGQLTLGVALSSYAATMAGHMLGNLIFISLGPSMLGIPSPVLTSIFSGLFWVSPIERIMITALSTLIMAPIIYVARNMYPDLFRG